MSCLWFLHVLCTSAAFMVLAEAMLSSGQVPPRLLQPLALGGWSQVPVTAENSAILVEALSKRANYAASITKPVCVKQVYRVRQQVVSGMNYLFEANACAIAFSDPLVGACGAAQENCHAAPFEIQVFSQPWTHTLRVEAIRWLD